ncbi:hypothetical protein [Sphingobacterium paucimobilis]|uniref:Uncharacterized protein n=1 Tax=Sphingobacterium paucimobilis HER1398 TaxID=1346330 RepID=U2IZS2_9SPHI|nr:hypothetical protein [Sphingobacterium paucimobilis]ERJ58184.1 hypothetical protein M472_05345 [Sphingobacterium paucimobilis HER1398]
MKRNAQNNPVTPGAIGTEQKTVKNLFKLKAMKTFRLLAFFALLGSVGYALANNQQSICEDKTVESYRQIDDQLPAPTLPPIDEPNMESVGFYETNFDCTTNAAATCHYVYDPTHPLQVDGWVECKGDYEQK